MRGVPFRCIPDTKYLIYALTTASQGGRTHVIAVVEPPLLQLSGGTVHLVLSVVNHSAQIVEQLYLSSETQTLQINLGLTSSR